MATRKRRRNGEGSITLHRASGRYMARYYDRDGVRRSVYGKDPEEAQRRLVAAQQATYSGVLVPGDRLTFGAFLQEWLSSTKPSVRPRTWTRYEMIVRRQLVPEIGKVRLSRLSQRHLSALYAKLLDTLSPRSVAHVHAVIRNALNDAMRKDLIVRNPAALISAPRVPARETEWLEREEVSALLGAAAGHPYEAFWSLAIGVGARIGELLGVSWKDIDWEAGTWRINATLGRTPEGLELTEPKTTRSRRKLRLPPTALEALKRRRAAQNLDALELGPAFDNQLDLIFTDQVGSPIDSTRFLRQYHYPLLKKAGVRRVGCHALRHTAASLLFAAGVPVPEISATLGHSSPATTLTVYAHFITTNDRSAVDALESVLSA